MSEPTAPPLLALVRAALSKDDHPASVRAVTDEAIALAINALDCRKGLRPGLGVTDVATVAFWIFAAFHEGMRVAAETSLDAGQPAATEAILLVKGDYVNGGERNWTRRDARDAWLDAPGEA